MTFDAALVVLMLSLFSSATALVALVKASWRREAWRALKLSLALAIVCFVIAIVAMPPKADLVADAAARDERRRVVAIEEAERDAVQRKNAEAEAAVKAKRSEEDNARRIADAEAAKAAAAEAQRVALAEARAPKPMLRDAIGCRVREAYDRLSKIAASGDEEAFRKLAVSLVASSQCRTMKQGTKIYLEDTAIFAGLLCGRPAGETACYWLPIEITK